MTPLRATVRLQLRGGFGLRDAAERVPYYAALGISHFYLSPIGVAVPGSTHGYDVVDPGRVDPALGGEEALTDLVSQLRAHGMGLVLDIVPNHVAAHADNPWWWDVLENGRDSRHASWFDIDWNAPGCGGKLWLPVLDRPCAQAFADGMLVPAVDDRGRTVLRHGDLRFPLRVDDPQAPEQGGARQRWLQALAERARVGDDTLRRLLERQPYRLAWWRTASDRINYRRFFDITSLTAVRMEMRAVFDAMHALPLRLIGEGLVDGLRIDHIDGLADPRGYLRRLRREVDLAARRCGIAPGRIALFVEKILSHGEALPGDWRCDGTTGYDFMDQVGAVLHDPAGDEPLRALWRQWSGRHGDYATEERVARGEMLDGSLQAEFQRTLRALQAAAHDDPLASEFGGAILSRALAALLMQYPVYRTYAHRDGLRGDDAARVAGAAERACADAEPGMRAAIEAIARLLGNDDDAPAAVRARRRILRLRVEQLSAPLQAKAAEDTAFYRHGVLLSRNEVGSDPGYTAIAAADFHAACAARAQRHPRALLITASHDHKRGEDVRARLAVLSERGAWWTARVDEFQALCAPLRESQQAPSAGDLLMLWQTIVGAWPFGVHPNDDAGMRPFAARIVDWQRKAMREAKLATSWSAPDEDYERAAGAMTARILLAGEGEALRTALWCAAKEIGPAGASNALVQTTLRLTVPGTPDLYQGTEGWDLSLVDPDNRRAVDYAVRESWLRDERTLAQKLHDWRDGGIKAHLIAKLLRLREREPALFANGDYRPLRASGPMAGHVLAFERHHGQRALMVAVPIRASRWLALDRMSGLDADAWQRTVLPLGAGRWRHALEPRDHAAVDGCLPLATLFRHCPVAILVANP